jgi:hypothetical protein
MGLDAVFALEDGLLCEEKSRVDDQFKAMGLRTCCSKQAYSFVWKDDSGDNDQ